MIILKDPPPVPGLQFRFFQGESDYPLMAAVITASEAADQVNRNVTADDLANAYKHMRNCDPYKDMILAEINGQLVGYMRGWWENDTDSGRIYHLNGFLVPDWRRKGIGRAMLRWMESHLSALADSHPPATRHYQVNVSQFQAGAASLLQGAGYQPVRSFYEMVRPTLNDIVEHPLPSGLEIRPVLPEHYPVIWRAADEISRDEWGYSQPTEEDYQEWLSGPHFQPHLWQIAWESGTDRVVGHVLTFINHAENKQRARKRGYTEGVGVERQWRGRGVARALISRSLLAQRAAGMSESGLVADSDSSNNVTRLYESCGFQIVKCDTIYRKAF